MAGEKPSSIGLFDDDFVASEVSDTSSFGIFRDELPEILEETSSAYVPKKRIGRSLDSYSEKERKEALRRLSYIKWVQKHNKAGWTEKNIKPLLAEVPEQLQGPAPAWRTLVEWRRAYVSADHSLHALVPKHRKKGNRDAKVVDDSLYYWRAVEEKYLRKERISIAQTYKYYTRLITLANKNVVEGAIPSVCKRAFYSRIQKLPPYEVMVARYGKQYADRNFNEVGTHVPVTRVLERVEIDHTPLDLILLDDELLIPLGRPYLTALIDAYSKCIVGFNIGYREPSYDAVRKALLNSMLGKGWIKERYPEIIKDWPCSGKIETLVVDNGAEFWSNDLDEVCRVVVENVQYNPVANPWLKPLIERFFQTVNNKLLCAIPGKTFSNVAQLKDYKPEIDAVLRVSTFIEIFHKWIVDEYHYESDDRETQVPIWKWYEGEKQYPPAQYLGNAADRLIIELGQTRERFLHKTGIVFLRINYSSPELAEYRKQYPPSAGKKELKVKIKINPSSLARIFVYLEYEEKYIEVPSVDSSGYTLGLTLFQHQTNLRVTRLRTRSRLEPVHLAETGAYIDQRIQDDIDIVVSQGKRKTRKMKGAKTVAKYRNVGSDGVSTIVPKLSSDENNPEVKGSKEIDDAINGWDDMVSDLDAY